MQRNLDAALDEIDRALGSIEHAIEGTDVDFAGTLDATLEGRIRAAVECIGGLAPDSAPGDLLAAVERMRQALERHSRIRLSLQAMRDSAGTELDRLHHAKNATNAFLEVAEL